eukprot:15718-Heterococcus_DN1.PRE.2
MQQSQLWQRSNNDSDSSSSLLVHSCAHYYILLQVVMRAAAAAVESLPVWRALCRPQQWGRARRQLGATAATVTGVAQICDAHTLCTACVGLSCLCVIAVLLIPIASDHITAVTARACAARHKQDVRYSESISSKGQSNVAKDRSIRHVTTRSSTAQNAIHTATAAPAAACAATVTAAYYVTATDAVAATAAAATTTAVTAAVVTFTAAVVTAIAAAAAATTTVTSL